MRDEAACDDADAFRRPCRPPRDQMRRKFAPRQHARLTLRHLITRVHFPSCSGGLGPIPRSRGGRYNGKRSGWRRGSTAVTLGVTPRSAGSDPNWWTVDVCGIRRSCTGAEAALLPPRYPIERGTAQRSWIEGTREARERLHENERNRCEVQLGVCKVRGAPIRNGRRHHEMREAGAAQDVFERGDT